VLRRTVLKCTLRRTRAGLNPACRPAGRREPRNFEPEELLLFFIKETRRKVNDPALPGGALKGGGKPVKIEGHYPPLPSLEKRKDCER